MSDETASFIDFMRAHNCGPAIPSEIKPTDKWINYTIEGDPPAKKKGRCKFKIEDMGVGCFTDWRSGEWVAYPPKGTKPPKTYTDAEKAEYKAKREANSKAADAEKEAGYKEGAKTAQALYGSSKPCLEHPYLTAKKVKPHGIRQHGDKLVIPMYGADGQISSLQTIEPDGEKDYHWKGRKGYYPLAGPEDNKDIIIICEGFSTSATVREATQLPVICAFDAANLKETGKIMRKKYPTARIIFGCDNDLY